MYDSSFTRSISTELPWQLPIIESELGDSMAHKELNKFSEHISFFQKATGLMLVYINCPFIAGDNLHAP